LSNLIEQFDANYNSGIGLYDSIVDLIETSRVETPKIRQVADEAVFAVAERALTASALLPMDVQHFNAIREVTNFLTLASNGAISQTVSKHTDLLPINHPASTSIHEFSASELRQVRSEWIAADPRIEDDSVRAVVAAAYASNPNSLDFHYNLVRLSALKDQVPSDLRIFPLVAFGDPYAGKNSFWHRKQRAEGQRRDDEGQFAEMGGGGRIYVRMPDGRIISVVGKVAGIPENDPNGVDLEITDVDGIVNGIYTVPADKAKFFKAILPEDAVPQDSPVGPGLNVDFISIEDMVRKSLPTSWYETTGTSVVRGLAKTATPVNSYATGDGYFANEYKNSGDIQARVNEARDKFGSLVVNTKGTDSLESGKPVYELISSKRGQPEVVGYAQDWSTLQAMAQAEDKNYPDAENEPIAELPAPIKGPDQVEEEKTLRPSEPEEEKVIAEKEDVDVSYDDWKDDNSPISELIDNPLENIPSKWRGIDLSDNDIPNLEYFYAGKPFVFWLPTQNQNHSKNYMVVAPNQDSVMVQDFIDQSDAFPMDAEFGQQFLKPFDGMWSVFRTAPGGSLLFPIGFAASWDSVDRLIKSYESLGEEGGPIVDEKVSIPELTFYDTRFWSPTNTKADNTKLIGSKSKVDISFLDPRRYDLLEPMSPEIAEKIKKDETNKNYTDIGGLDIPLGPTSEGLGEGILYPQIANLFIMRKYPEYKAQAPGSISKDLLNRKQYEPAVDMWDEMMDYPENFTLRQALILYHNLTNMFKDNGPKNSFSAPPQQREKLRRAIRKLAEFDIPKSEYSDIQEQIDNYRFAGAGGPNNSAELLRKINLILANYRGDQSEIGLTFKDKIKVKGSEVLAGRGVLDKEGNILDIAGGDAILDSDGGILQVLSVEQATPDDDQTEADVEDKLDLVVLRDGLKRAYQIGKNDDVTVYRGSGVLPTKENLKIDAEMRAITPQAAPAAQEEEDIFEGGETYGDEIGSEATYGKATDPSQVKNPLKDFFIDGFKKAFYARLIEDKKLYDRAVEIMTNPSYYGYSLAKTVLDKLNELDRRPDGEFTADVSSIISLKNRIKNDSTLSLDEKKALLKNIHMLSSAEAKDKLAEYGEMPASSSAFFKPQDIISGSNLVTVISQYTDLTEISPDVYKGLCIFHEETTPSLEVYVADKNRQRFYCYGCKEHGDAINVVTKKEGVSPREAVLRLAKQFGIQGGRSETLNKATAKEIAKKQGFDDIDPELYAPYGTDLIGEGAPTPGLMVEAKHVIENYEINPDNPAYLKWFLDNHRMLPYQEWQKLIETWKKPEYSKHRPTLLTNHVPQGKGGPTNRQLASIERVMEKGILPKEFLDYIMENYPIQLREWFAKVLDITKTIEDEYDAEVLRYAIANLRDIEGLRVPPKFTGLPDPYNFPPDNKGISLDLDEAEMMKQKYLAVFPKLVRDKFAADEFWNPLLDSIAPLTGQDPDSMVPSEEEQRKRTILTEARKIDLRRARKSLKDFIGNYVEPYLVKSPREMNVLGKRALVALSEEISSLIGALNGSRRNIIQDSPAEFDRRLKILVSALGMEGNYTFYGIRNLNSVNQATKDNLSYIASELANLVGTYQAGQSAEDQAIVDKMMRSNIAPPKMPRFNPPAFIGQALDPLKNMTSWEDVRDFISKLDLYVFDFETTGIIDVNDPQIKNDPIQLAIAKAVNFSIQSSYNAYINPESPLSQFTLQTIGDGTGKKVTKEFLSSQRSKVQAMKEFLEMVPQGAVLVGHNGLIFDIEVLNRTLREAGLPEYKFGGFIDTYGLSYHVMPEWTPENPNAPYKLSEYPINGERNTPVRSDTLESLVVYFGLSNNGRHEADSDVISTVEILDSLLKYAASGKSASGRDFDFSKSTNQWSEQNYIAAESKYKNELATYQTIMAQSYIGVLMNNLSITEIDPDKVINDFIEALSRKSIEVEDNKGRPMPAPKVVAQLPAGSYVYDLSSDRIGRSYGTAENGRVLVEFATVGHLSSAKKTLEFVVPSSLFNITDDLITKDGLVLDYGMSVNHPELGKDAVGVLSNFEKSGIAQVVLGNALYRVVAKDLSVLPYSGTLIPTKEQLQKVSSLLDKAASSESLSKDFVDAIRKTVSMGAYPRSALSDLIKMLVNANNEKNLVELNKSAPEALQESQSSASGAIVDKMARKKITPADLKGVKVDTSLVKANMPNIKITKEVEAIIKAGVMPAVNKGKSLNKKYNNLFVPALAGTGKTTALEIFAWVKAAMNPNLKILYSVFGKKNQKEADIRLGGVGNTTAKTLDALSFNASANDALREKFKFQGESSGENLLNPMINPQLVADAFAFVPKYKKELLDKYGINIDDGILSSLTPSDLVRLAYDGLDNWTVSADRDLGPQHFEYFRMILETAPIWSPGASGIISADDVDSFTTGEDGGLGAIVAKDLITPRLSGPAQVAYVRYNSKGKIAFGFNEKEFKKNRNQILKNQGGEAAKEYDASWTRLEKAYFYEADYTANNGFFIDELILMAQEMWDDIVGPYDPEGYRLSLPVIQKHFTKNWSLGNVDITAAIVNAKKNKKSIQGLKDIPDIWLIDEAQDLSPVFIDILKRQQIQYDNGVQIVVVGDRHQAIMQYAGRENAMEPGVIPDNMMDASLSLTTNYRSAKEILEAPNDVLDVLGSEDKLVAGKTTKGTIVNPNTLVQEGMWVISRTNAGILDAAVELKSEGGGFSDNDPFAILPNLKKRLKTSLNGLLYLSRVADRDRIKLNYETKLAGIQEDINALEDEISRVPDGQSSKISAIQKEQAELANEKNEIEQKLSKLISDIEEAKIPKGMPAALKGRNVTIESVRLAVEGFSESGGSESGDLADIKIILNLAKNMKELNADGEPRPKKLTKALAELLNIVELLRVVDENNLYGVPEVIGKAGGLGGKLAYTISNGKIQLSNSKDWLQDPDEIYGVWNNRTLLESLGFTRVAKENPDDREEKQPLIWEREIFGKDDEDSLRKELQEIIRAVSGEDAVVTLLTGHTAKGLENEAVRIWNDWNPNFYDDKKEEQKVEDKNAPKLTPEQQEEEDARKEQERLNKQIARFNRAEINLIYVALTRAMGVIDFGGLADFLTPDGLETLRRAINAHEGTDEPVVDKMFRQSSGDYYERVNQATLNQKESYLKSLDLSLKTPQMERITPFRYASNADIEFAKQQTKDEIFDLLSNPDRRRNKDESNRLSLMQILEMIRRGDGISALGDFDRNRLYAYLASSSLGGNSAFEKDPTDKIVEAIEELNRRLNID
jgi:DNA polymerase III epsilon subunit-like protein